MNVERTVLKRIELRARLDRRYDRALSCLGRRLRRLKKQGILLSHVSLAARVPLPYLSWLVHESEHRDRISSEAVLRVAKTLSNLEEGWNCRTTSRTR